MRTTAVAIIISLIIGAGIYASISNLVTRYAVRTSGSLAGQYSCVPDTLIAQPNHSVIFTASIPEGTTYFWSTPGAINASFLTSGPLTVQYNQVGTKTAYLFFQANNIWQRISCAVQVR